MKKVFRCVVNKSEMIMLGRDESHQPHAADARFSRQRVIGCLAAGGFKSDGGVWESGEGERRETQVGQAAREKAGVGLRGAGHLPSRGLVRPLLLQSNWMGGSASCWRSDTGGVRR